MMETIVSWLSQALGQALEALIDLFLSGLELDLQVFVDSFPIIATSYSVFQKVALAIALWIAFVQIAKFVTGQENDVRDAPQETLVRTGVAVLMIFFGGHFLNLVVNLCKMPYDVFAKGINAVSWQAIGFSFADMDASTFLADTLIIGGQMTTAILLLTLLAIILIGFNLLKLCLEVYERFLMVGVLVYTSPLAFSTLSSQSSSQIFKKWCGMFFGQCVLMILSVWSLRFILSGFQFVDDSSVNNFTRLVLVLAACKISQRLDTYMQQLGIGVPTTGGNLLDDIVAASRTMNAVSRNGRKPADSVLGGGSRLPGVLGATSNAVQAGLGAFKAGGNKEEVSAAMTGAFKQKMNPKNMIPGYQTASRLSSERQANVAAQAAENSRKGVEAYNANAARYNSANGTAEGYTKDIQKTSADFGMTAQQYTAAQFQSSGAGSVVKGENGRGIQLDDTAKKAGLVWIPGADNAGRPNQIKGTSQAVGDHMAKNYSTALQDSDYQASMVETAKNGSQLASQEALMGTNHDLSGNDQLGAALMDKGLGESLGAAYDDTNGDMAEFTSAVMLTSNGQADAESGMVENINAKGNLDTGRKVECDYKASSGNQYKVEVADAQAYHKSSLEEQKTWKPIQTNDGTRYYTRYSQVVVDSPSSGRSGPATSGNYSGGNTSSRASGAPSKQKKGFFGRNKNN